MSDRNYGVVRSAEQFEKFVDRIVAQGKPFGFDIESGYVGEARDGIALKPFHPDWRMAGFSFTNSTEWARYVPVGHADGDNVDDVPRVARALWRLLASNLGVAHNLSFEMKGLGRWFQETCPDDEEMKSADYLIGYLSDSLIESFLTQQYEPLRVGQDLKSLTKHVFGHVMTRYEELFTDDTGKQLSPAKIKKSRFTELPLTPQVVTYACEDSVWCLALHLKHHPELADQMVYKSEIALVPILVKMEREALLLDWDEIDRKANETLELRGKINEEIQKNLSERLDRVVNINLGSVKQLSTILFEDLGLPVKERSDKTGAPSTSEKALRLIAKEDSVVRKILEYREIVKLYGSYLDKYRTELNYAGNGRAYPNHKQTGAGTGRMSVDGVSYQQWPKPYHYELEDGTVFDLNFRNLLISPPGWRGIGFDYSQVELRVLAGQASETAMLKAFADGTDIHKATASTMMGIPLLEITKKERGTGKTLNFAVVYGSGAENIASMLSTPESPVSKEDAEKLLEKYYAAFPNLRAWMDNKIVEGRQQGYVENLFGRRFTVWEYQDSRSWIRSKGDRMCVNAPIQGGAADYCKIAMIRADKAIREAGLQDRIKMFMMVHDALEFYVHDSVDTQTVLDILGPAVSYRVPGLPEIQADWHEFQRWGEPVDIARDAEGQITHYEIEDVDQTFASIEEAYAYYEALNDPEKAADEPENLPAEDEAPAFMDAVVTLAEMPDANQWALFRDLLDKHKGPDGSMTLVTPEGTVEFENIRLTPQDQPTVSALLGGATLTFRDERIEDTLVSLAEGVLL